MPREHNKVKI